MEYDGIIVTFWRPKKKEVELPKQVVVEVNRLRRPRLHFDWSDCLPLVIAEQTKK